MDSNIGSPFLIFSSSVTVECPSIKDGEIVRLTSIAVDAVLGIDPSARTDRKTVQPFKAGALGTGDIKRLPVQDPVSVS
jgi:hypothetical protein